MRNVTRPDRFLISIGQISPGPYMLVFDDTVPSKLLPKICIEGFFGSQIVINRYERERGAYFATFPQQAEPFLRSGDIASVTSRSLRIVLSRKASSNTLLLTERCNNLCAFCSQPPKDADDSHLFQFAKDALIEFDYDGVVGLTGGEPFMFVDEILHLLDSLHQKGTPTKFHILTNGRAFNDQHVSSAIAERAKDGRICLGIPLYSTEPDIHDQLVGCRGAWIETITGLINLHHAGVTLELRFIPTQQNTHEIAKIVPFIARALPFISQLSIMNLEPTGWARKNWGSLYQSPKAYLSALSAAHTQARIHNINLVLFNYPLCHVLPSEYEIARQSISDWKNTYQPECQDCSMRAKCTGFFSSAIGAFLEPPRRIA